VTRHEHKRGTDVDLPNVKEMIEAST